MSEQVPSPQELNELWRSRLQTALRQYESAKGKTVKLWKEHVHGLTPNPDGAFGLQQALQEEVMALNEYRRVLDVYYQLAVHGHKPQVP
jgi:hypothetical protein